MPGEPPVGIKSGAEQFRDFCCRDGWGAKGEQVHLILVWGEDIDLYHYRVDGGEVTTLDNFKCVGDQWDMEVRDEQ